MKLTNIEASQVQRVVLYGPPKSGKTELAGRLAERYKLLYIGNENGHSTLMKLPQEWKERIEIVAIPDSRVFPISIETWMKIVKGAAVNICDFHGKVDCPACKRDSAKTHTRVCLDEVGPDTIVIFDSLTQLTNSGIAHITKNQPDDYKLQLDDWGALKVLMDKFLSQIQVAKYNVVCITHEEEAKLEGGSTKIVPVCGSSNSSRNTAKYFDHVVYCELKNKKHMVGSATTYAMSALTGSRTDVSLENGTEGASLLDMFVTWKLPNYGMIEAKENGNGLDISSSNAGSNSGNGNVGSVSNPGVHVHKTDVQVAITKPTQPVPTPGINALAALRAKQAEMAAVSKGK